MKQVLGLRLGQRQAMTLQMQQAIRLMQLSAAELRTEVRQAIETNPMLEFAESEEDPADEGTVAEAEEDDAVQEHSESDPEEAEAPAPLEDIPDELAVDVSWEDVYQPTSSAPASAAPEGDERSFEERNGTAQTLLDHLRWQLNLTPLSDRDQLIAHVVIDSVDDDGMLRATIDDLRATLAPELQCDRAEVEAVLKLVQRFDPPGVAARDVAECLLLQLEQLPEHTPQRDRAIDLVQRHFKLLAKRDFGALARRTKLDENELIAVMTLLQSLNPRPGAAFGEGDVEYVEPDVVVRRENGRWTVALNGEAAPPRLRLQNDYAGLVRRRDSSPENQYLRENLQDAKLFLKGLELRNETLLKVAAEIVHRQRGFLERGPEAMQPMVLADVATAVERHESTISRVTTRKYIDTPRGIYELKYFFSSHVATSGGGEMSSTAIRAVIKKLVAEEDQRKPLSDNKIASILQQRNIEVARRTVAKYRESLAIPPSNERRRHI